MADDPRAVEAVIERFEPNSVPVEAAGFAKEVVRAAAPASAKRAKALLFASSKLGAFGISCGLELSGEVLLHPSVIERFAASERGGMSLSTRRTIRTNLRAVAASALGPAPPACPLPRDRPKAPYLREEIASYLALADAQPTRSRRLRASALVCLGAGAGVMGAELRHLEGSDVAVRSGGVVVVVAGRRPRVVPVLEKYHDRLLEAAGAAGGGLLLGGSTGDPNVVSRLTASLAGGPGLARIDTGRLRATWLVAVAELLGLRAFMDAAGVRSSQRIGDLVNLIEAPSETEAVARLGGAG